jgi:hypothetical protein
MKTKPLPCPFCGSIPTVGPPNESTEGTCFGWVRCENPKCTVNPEAEDRRKVNGDEGREHYRQMAVANWNCRMNAGSDAPGAVEKP